MGKIYYHQSSLRLQLTTSVNITSALTLQIKYKKPDNSTGEWVAVSGDDASGVIYYDFTGIELDQVGSWVFWAYVEFSDGRTAPGEPVVVMVYTEGN